MRMHHFWVQNGPFVLNKGFLAQAIVIIFIYLLTLFIVQNFKKKFPADPELWGCTILGPKWPIPQIRIFSENLLMSPFSFIHAWLYAKNQSQILIY